MEASLQELASLLAPISLAQFFAEYWETQPLVVKSSDRNRYDRLMTRRALEEVISYSNLRYPAIKLAKDGRFFSPETFTSDVEVGTCTFSGVADPRKIADLYSTGASITLPCLDRSWRPITELCSRMEDGMDHPIHANAYLTPGRSRGFAPHYDCHDVLVLQIGGSKRWLIDAPETVLPHSSQVFNPEGFRPGPRLMEIDLDAGDLLYLPRGFVHSTVTSHSYSAHVTIGISVHSWVDCVAHVVKDAVEVPKLRRALPPGFASNAQLRTSLVQQLRQLLAATPFEKEADGLFDQFALRVRVSRHRAPAPFSAERVVISLDSELHPPGREEYQLAQREDHLALSFEGRTYGFSASLRSTLNAICERPQFRLQELSPQLEEQQLLRLGRFLHGIGFLQPVTVPPS